MKNTYICQLSTEEQTTIRNILTKRLESEGYSLEEIAHYVELAMNSKISDIDMIEIAQF